MSSTTPLQKISQKRAPQNKKKKVKKSIKTKQKRTTDRKKKKKRSHSNRYKVIATLIGALTAIIVYFLLFTCIKNYFFYHHLPDKSQFSSKLFSIKGIDISRHQEYIDWDSLSTAKIDNQPISFIFIKATEGTQHIDPYFNQNFYSAREYGFTRSAYHFFLPNLPAKDQAIHYLRQVKLEEGDLPPILDIERTGNLTTPQLQNKVLTWLNIVEQHYKCKPIIYTFASFKNSFLNTSKFKEYPFWIAHYYVEKPNFSDKWKFWQYTDSGKLKGIKNHVDCNIFNGSMYELNQLKLRDFSTIQPNNHTSSVKEE